MSQYHGTQSGMLAPLFGGTPWKEQLSSIQSTFPVHNSTQHNTAKHMSRSKWTGWEEYGGFELYDYDGSVLWFSFTSATSFVSSTTPICLFVCISSLPHSLLLERRQEFGKFDDIYFAATLLNVPTRHLSFLNIVQCASVAFINILCFCQHCGHVFVLAAPNGQNLCFLWYKNIRMIYISGAHRGWTVR